jgi:hypothetical protein
MRIPSVVLALALLACENHAGVPTPPPPPPALAAEVEAPRQAPPPPSPLPAEAPPAPAPTSPKSPPLRPSTRHAQPPAGQDAQVAVSDFNAYGNCMPRIMVKGKPGAGPFVIVWNLDVQHAQGPGVALEGARLHVLTGERPQSYDLTVDVPRPKLASGALHVQQRAQPGKGAALDVCGILCSTRPRTALDVRYRVDGKLHELHAESKFECVY